LKIIQRERVSLHKFFGIHYPIVASAPLALRARHESPAFLLRQVPHPLHGHYGEMHGAASRGYNVLQPKGVP
jgi:hypothetical protein